MQNGPDQEEQGSMNRSSGSGWMNRSALQLVAVGAGGFGAITIAGYILYSTLLTTAQPPVLPEVTFTPLHLSSSHKAILICKNCSPQMVLYEGWDKPTPLSTFGLDSLTFYLNPQQKYRLLQLNESPNVNHNYELQVLADTGGPPLLRLIQSGSEAGEIQRNISFLE